MLPAHIIEQILEREKCERTDNRPQITLDLPVPMPGLQKTEPQDTTRGVVVIDLLGTD